MLHNAITYIDLLSSIPLKHLVLQGKGKLNTKSMGPFKPERIYLLWNTRMAFFSFHFLINHAPRVYSVSSLSRLFNGNTELKKITWKVNTLINLNSIYSAM